MRNCTLYLTLIESIRKFQQLNRRCSGLELNLRSTRDRHDSILQIGSRNLV